MSGVNSVRIEKKFHARRGSKPTGGSQWRASASLLPIVASGKVATGESWDSGKVQNHFKEIKWNSNEFF